jgi:hypothetical protein
MKLRGRGLGQLWGCPSPSLCLGGGSGFSHNETWAGSIVSLTTPMRSPLKASRSVSSRKLGREGFQGLSRVVFAAIEAPIYEALYAAS